MHSQAIETTNIRNENFLAVHLNIFIPGLFDFTLDFSNK